MLRAVAAGVGCSFESVSKDFTQTNYSSSRLSLLEERDTWRVLQKFMIENFHQPIYEAWLEMAVMSGELSIQGYEISPDRFRKIQWMPRGWSWVDPQKEVEAYKTAVRCGFKTLSDVVSEQGGDLEDLLLQRQAELAKFDELGIVLDTDPTQVNDAGAQQPVPLVETPTPTEYDSEDEVIA
jgi:lambda family phage portal protein